MEATVMDLRRRMKSILRALDRNEPVTLLYRGKKKAVIQPIVEKQISLKSVTDQEAFGMWKDRKDMSNVNQYVRKLRRGRYRDL
jgi:antitoxin (DNA-binding transcriptional repressor) of toxin-antitoxin stability system